VPLHDWIYHWEEGGGAKVLKVTAAILGFIALAALVDALAYPAQCFSNEEAMETAQLARNLARGKGYTTETVRPLSIYLLRKQAPPGQAADVLNRPVPDLATPPAYAVLLAGLMYVLPFDYVANQNQAWYFAPDRWISIFNQGLLFAAVFLLFCIARRLFDLRVAWVSAALLAGSDLFWKFSLSGLSTMWLMVVLLAAVLALVRLQERELKQSEGFGSLALAVCVGACIGVGGLSRYAFAWMIVPVLLFIVWVAPRNRGKLVGAAAAAFLVVLGPWIARNVVVSGAPCGTASYGVLEGIPPFPEDALERSFDPSGGFRRVGPLDLMDKFVGNARDIWRNDLPRLGGSWVSAFFLVGLCVPFRKPALGRIRVFLAGSLAVLFVVQAAGQTHLTTDSPIVNSENLLSLLAPLIFVYGVALFYTLLDQMHLIAMNAKGAVVGGFILLCSAPLLMSMMAGATGDVHSPYSPLHIQRVAGLMRSDEFIASDIPGAVAWYGDRSCGWLPLDDDQQFYLFNSLKPIKAVFLTQKTTNSRFLSQMMREPKSWGHFIFECESHGEVPSGFPLTKAPSHFLPDQLLVSDQARWRNQP